MSLVTRPACSVSQCARCCPVSITVGSSLSCLRELNCGPHSYIGGIIKKLLSTPGPENERRRFYPTGGRRSCCYLHLTESLLSVLMVSKYFYLKAQEKPGSQAAGRLQALLVCQRPPGLEGNQGESLSQCRYLISTFRPSPPQVYRPVRATFSAWGGK